jgi:pimeloyl-ACP methyl ester carboxylesterase
MRASAAVARCFPIREEVAMREFLYDGDGVQLYAVEDGQGRAIVMLHGGGADHRACLPVIQPLSSGFRVIAPDWRGSGRSWCADALSWDRLAEDVESLMDHAGANRAAVGGISLGTGIALRFALRFPMRMAGLVLVTPVYRGGQRGLTQEQAAIFSSLEPAIARAAEDGIEAFRSLYQRSPAMEAYFDAMIRSADLASFVATNQFMASGAQPFMSSTDLEAIAVPTLLIPGNDPMHPAEVSNLYAAKIPNCTTVGLSDTTDYAVRNTEIAAAIAEYCERNVIW